MNDTKDPLEQKLNYLRLKGLSEHWDDYLKLAARKNFSHTRLLKHLVDEEYRIRRENASRLRLRKARIPEALVIETFPFDRQPRLNRKKIMALYDCLGYMKNSQNIIWLGGTGRGKTGLATGFLIHAVNQGYSGRYVLFAELINDLYRSVADHSQQKVLKKYLSWDCLLIDEVGYVQVEPVQVGLFFTLMQKRHKKKSTLLTSNLGFSEWGSFLRNDHLTAALVDRLTESSHVINMKQCRSLRSKLTPDNELPNNQAKG
jgi:DNA replication protein DnaC